MSSKVKEQSLNATLQPPPPPTHTHTLTHALQTKLK